MNKLVSTACVLICAGCATTEPSRLPSEEFLSEQNAVTFAAMRADNAAGRTDSATAMATAMYWMGIKSALHPIPIDSQSPLGKSAA